MNCCGTDCAWVDLKRCFAAHRPQMPMPGGGDHTHAAAIGATPTHAHDAPVPVPTPPRAHDHDTPAPAPLPTPPGSLFDLVPEHIMLVQEHIHMLGPMPEHMPPPEPMIVLAQPAPDPIEAAKKGYWELLPCEAPILTVHAALMHTGKILFFAGSGNDELYTTGFRSTVYDHENGGFTMPPTPTDVFCAGQTILPDGRVLVAGGTERYDPFVGLRTALLFDPISELWTFVQSMKNGRWYPTLMTLGDGRGMVASGGGSPEDEIYENPTASSVAGPGIGWPLYPHLHLFQNSRAFRPGSPLEGSRIQPGFL